MKFYIPQDTTALACGAAAAAHALQAAGIKPVRNGSRGMFWLEPLLEVDTGAGRIGFGPVSSKDIPSILDALEADASSHDLYLGQVERKFKGLISSLITVVSEVDTSCALPKVVKVYTFIKLLLSGPR